MRNPLDAKVRELETKVVRLEKQLHTAHTILDVQGKVPSTLRAGRCVRWSSSKVEQRRVPGRLGVSRATLLPIVSRGRLPGTS